MTKIQIKKCNSKCHLYVDASDPKSLTAAQVDQIEKARAPGEDQKSFAEIARALNVDRDFVRGHFRSNHHLAGPNAGLFIEGVDNDFDIDSFAGQLVLANEAQETAEAAGLEVRGIRVKDPSNNGVTLTLKPPTKTPTITVQQAEPVDVIVRSTNRLPKRRTADGIECAAIFADSQVGYWIDRDGNWHTTHDEAALDLSLQILADLDAEHGVDVVVDLGDLLDLPSMSTHPSAVNVTRQETINKSISRAHTILAQRTALTPTAHTRRWIRGNHEQRWEDWLGNNAPHLLGLTRAGEEGETPVLSLPYLARVAEAGWTLSDEYSYPNDILWLNDNTRCIHGTVAQGRATGSLAKYLLEPVNTIAGHTPHAGVAHATGFATRKGNRTYVACVPGGCMRVDGMVPSMASKNNTYGEPSKSNGAPWEQGMAICFYEPGEGTSIPTIEHVPFFGGRATWRGKAYVARCDVDGNPIDQAA